MTSRNQVFGRAGRLLAKVLALGMDANALSLELVVTPRELDDFRSGRTLMPLDRQLCLALLVMKTVPELAKEGRTLRAQVAAAAAFHFAETTTLYGPPMSFGFPGAGSRYRQES